VRSALSRGGPFLSLLLVTCLSGCVRRSGINADCQWPNEAVSPLDLRDPGQARHLDNDAQFAEELAIRHGDAFLGRETAPERGRRVEQCTAQLTAWIVRIHDVTPDDVQRAREHRELRVDVVTVFVPMALLFAVVATLVADRVRRRFPWTGDRWPAIAATALAAVAVSLAVAVVGEVWSWAVEMVRVGDSHLSNRALRLPWGRHRPAICFAGVVLFVVIAWWRDRRSGDRS
jgi:hypothetical protein